MVKGHKHFLVFRHSLHNYFLEMFQCTVSPVGCECDHFNVPLSALNNYNYYFY